MKRNLSTRQSSTLLVIAAFAIALNLRMVITSVGPMLDAIGSEQQISDTGLGMLGALPLLVWGLTSPFTHALSVRYGSNRTLTVAVTILIVGTLVRSFPGPVSNLWVGTALIGAGLAICNTLIPAVFKREAPSRVPMLMGLYTALLGLTAAIGAGFSVPIAQSAPASFLAPWEFSLLVFGIPLPIALALWVIATRRSAPLPTTTAASVSHQADVIDPQLQMNAGKRIWGDRLAWQVSLYMGAQSAIFYGMVSWLAPYAVSMGSSAVDAGNLVMLFSGLGMFTSLALPFATRIPIIKKSAPAATAAIMLISLIGVALAPNALLVWIVIGGLTGGASFTVALTLMAERARTPEHATALSGMGQALGYIVAACGPFAFGALLESTGAWTAPFALLWVCALAQMILGFFVARSRFVLTQPAPLRS